MIEMGRREGGRTIKSVGGSKGERGRMIKRE